ncbi:MAG TPA: putative porin [Anaeromyxobacter sp.]|nr:putative porin [Anaeromyxobacter sp.]
MTLHPCIASMKLSTPRFPARIGRERAVLLAPFLALCAIPAVRAAEPPASGTEPNRSAGPGPASEAPAAGGAPADPGTAKRVLYLPESVKQELREEIAREVLEQARRENWAAPNQVPEWVKKVRFGGDLRTRMERDLFPHGNAVGVFPDFNAINNNGPTDDNGIDLSNDRYLNVDRGVTRGRLRARVGLEAEPTGGALIGLRLGTGDQGSGVSSNQTLGSSGGFFSKYQFWLDRGFLRLGSRKTALFLGRFENPFLSTDLTWSENVGFDGLAVKAGALPEQGAGLFATGGVFPLYTTAFSYPAQSPNKFGAFNKWLYAGQLGGGVRAGEAWGLQLAAAFYYFANVEGHLASSCDTNLKYVSCSTDDSRPPYAQKGNTYMRLRSPSQEALAAEALSSATPRYQYWGLAARFRDLVATARTDVRLGSGAKAWLDVEAVRNMGFSARSIEPKAVNNCYVGTDTTCGRFLGGKDGYLGRLTLGSPTQEKRGDWSFFFTYRYLESDAVVDAFTDSDFGLGGTNLKGYIVGGTVAILDQVFTSARWMSADQITGPPFRSDAVMVDVSSRF